jgi:hypothetical protein
MHTPMRTFGPNHHRPQALFGIRHYRGHSAASNDDQASGTPRKVPVTQARPVAPPRRSGHKATVDATCGGLADGRHTAGADRRAEPSAVGDQVPRARRVAEVLERPALVGEKSAVLHDPASQFLSRTDVFAINTVSEWVKQTILSDVDSDLHDAIHQLNVGHPFHCCCARWSQNLNMIVRVVWPALKATGPPYGRSMDEQDLQGVWAAVHAVERAPAMSRLQGAKSVLVW